MILRASSESRGCLSLVTFFCKKKQQKIWNEKPRNFRQENHKNVYESILIQFFVYHIKKSIVRFMSELSFGSI